MKILHTSDWHLGNQIKKQDRYDEFDHILSELTKVVAENKPDAFVLSGDVFDTPVPPTAAQQQFSRALLKLHNALPDMPIVVIAGNHDGKAFLDANKELWMLANVHILGQLHRRKDLSAAPTGNILVDNFELDSQIIEIPGKGYVVAVPHIYDSGYPQLTEELEDAAKRRGRYFQMLLEEVNRRNKSHLPVVLMAHLAVTNCSTKGHNFDLIGGLTTTDQAAFGSNYDYLALGHIHQPQNFVHDGHVARYCGSLLPIAFDEDFKHGVSLVDVKAGNTTLDDITEIEIPTMRPLLTIPKTPSSFETALDALKEVADQDCYVRLNIRVDKDNLIPSNATELVHLTLNNRKARFGEFKITRDKADSNNQNALKITPDELQKKSPLEVAEAFQKLKGSEMHTRHKELMETVLQRLNNTPLNPNK